ncbi:MAG: hypothetical protein IJX87_06750 [Clostridia bacterium]|nr:hypothetical protein [Clostridia bacterium]
MENYVKVVLCAYPLLRTVGQDYAEHIRNKALLSYVSAQSTERLAEYLAEEILRKQKLEQLKELLDRVLMKLSEVERTLIEIRYFGKKRVKELLRSKGVKSEERAALIGSERSYFRQLRRVVAKVGGMLAKEGLTKEVYMAEYADIDIIRKIHIFVEKRDGEV